MHHPHSWVDLALASDPMTTNNYLANALLGTFRKQNENSKHLDKQITEQ